MEENSGRTHVVLRGRYADLHAKVVMDDRTMAESLEHIGTASG